MLLNRPIYTRDDLLIWIILINPKSSLGCGSCARKRIFNLIFCVPLFSRAVPLIFYNRKAA